MLGTKTSSMRSSSEDLRRFSIIPNQNFKKIGKSGKWYRSDFRKSFQKFRKLFNFLNYETFNFEILEIPGAKLNGKKTFGKKNFRKVDGYNSRGCPTFWKFWKKLFHSQCSLLEVAQNSGRTFWLNGNSDKTLFDRIGQFTL